MSGGDVTVIVPVWNGRELLERMLRGLRAQTQAAAEVLVVDDGSQDGSAETAEYMGARAIRMGSHGGFAKAVNRGIRESRTPLAAIVNNDVELAPDWLERLSAGLGEGAWFATGRILQAADRGREVARIDATYDALCRGGTAWRVGHGCPDGPPFREARVIRSAPFTAALFRAELFDKVGPLDERFESYLEDVDFGLRCALAGCAGRYVPEAVAWHQGSATLGRWHPETTRRTARNQVFLIAKHYDGRMLARYAWPIVVAQGLWGLVALRHGRGWAWMRGKVEGLRRFAELSEPRSRIAGETACATDAPGLPDILVDEEREIRRVQREAGHDLYWRLYFLLTAGWGKVTHV
ncbi:MAG TPA: glycosyltransferase family 2 protein [Bryobacteraceae bacterium]|jgi:GT2 family glycosyltransferase|nr:glycosyltransferase family 2 protein [Bryobacteraceae bacterium]